MAKITALSNIPYLTRLAGEALTAGELGCIKVSDGKIYKAVDSTGYIACGLVEESADSGANATLTFPVCWIDNSSTNALGIANLGTLAYAEDETTVSTNAANGDLIVGKLLSVDSSLGALVDLNIKATDVASAT